jgi:heme-degrading monooxygenase HmoA
MGEKRRKTRFFNQLGFWDNEDGFRHGSNGDNREESFRAGREVNGECIRDLQILTAAHLAVVWIINVPHGPLTQ